MVIMDMKLTLPDKLGRQFAPSFVQAVSRGTPRKWLF